MYYVFQVEVKGTQASSAPGPQQHPERELLPPVKLGKLPIAPCLFFRFASNCSLFFERCSCIFLAVFSNASSIPSPVLALVSRYIRPCSSAHSSPSCRVTSRVSGVSTVKLALISVSQRRENDSYGWKTHSCCLSP